MLFITSLVDYLNGRLLEKEDNLERRKIYLTVSILINLSLLGFFKYSNFLISIANSIFHLNIRLLNMSLPIEISFYTFQSISYSIDVYRKSVDVEQNYFRYLTYLSLFPQLIAGPIVRYKDVSAELKSNNIVKENVVEGLLKFLRGLYKKVLLANSIGYL